MSRRAFTIMAVLMLLVPLLATLGGRGAVAQDASPVAGASPAAMQMQPDPSVSGTIDVGMVGNPQMVTLQQLVEKGEFNKVYPNVKVNLTVLPENEIRQTITQDVSTQSGQFDLFTVGTFEVPLWGKNGWLEEVGDDVANDTTYDLNDIFPAHRDGLSSDGKLYGLPFYGESSMTFYRKDLFEKAGIEMPERPTWQQIGEFARKLHDPQGGTYGICLRGLPGWGEQLAPLTTVINAYGGRWYDEDWKAQLDSKESSDAIRFYIELLQQAGEPGAEQAGFTECETLFNQGKVAMWYDATSAADLISDPSLNPNAANVGYAYPPSAALPTGSWLWNWSFAMAKNTDAKDASLAFMKWATSKDYVNLVGSTSGLGWGKAPTGSRQSTYANPAYEKYASGFYKIVLSAIKEANPNKPTRDPVPYTGGQFVRIPEFQDLGNNVSQQFAAAIVKQQSVDDAIKKANDLANQTAIDGGYQT
jgi:sorbitol/mannitol transport system substrate-binding protein